MRNELVFDRVVKTCGQFQALADVSLTVNAGEFMTLLGPSGSGKTTLLMTLAGFVDPTSGHVIIDGNDITGFPPERRNFGMVFQGYALFPHMTVAENVGYPLRIRKVQRGEIASRVEDTLRLIQLEHLASRYPEQLSGGQQQRVALARALVFKPELLLLDEPLSALDRALRKDLQRELKDIHDRVGTTFIYVIHDQEEALSMSDRIAILREGKIEQLGRPEELYEEPQTIFVANFLGKSNFLRARMSGRDGDGLIYSVGNQDFRRDGHKGAVPEGDFSVALRPERLRLFAADGAECSNRIPGVISKVSYFGQSYEVIVTTELAGDLIVHMPIGSGAIKPGEQAHVGWKKTSGVPLEGTVEDAGELNVV